jgi:hypothetical protein
MARPLLLSTPWRDRSASGPGASGPRGSGGGASGGATATPPATKAGASVPFTALECVSFAHSCIYCALLVCAFAAGKPEPATFALGLAHGLLWIGMSLICLTAARLRIVPLRLAVAVAVLGGLGPFFGSYEFVREQRRRARFVPAD